MALVGFKLSLNFATLTYKALILILRYAYARAMMPLEAGRTSYSSDGFVI